MWSDRWLAEMCRRDMGSSQTGLLCFRSDLRDMQHMWQRQSRESTDQRDSRHMMTGGATTGIDRQSKPHRLVAPIQTHSDRQRKLDR
jgi:hypothetical protein